VVGLDSITDYYSVELKKRRIEKLLIQRDVEFHEIDLTDAIKFSALLRDFKPEAVVHLAAQPGVRLPIAQFGKYIDSNLVGFANTFKTVLEQEIPNFIYASSSSVYGDDSKIPYNESERNLNPRSFYGATKLANEVLAKSVENNKTQIRGLRFFTVYGPWGRPDMAYFKIAEALKNDRQFDLYGDGTVLRDFTFIEDTVNSITKLLENLCANPPGVNDVVNVGGGKPQSMLELISHMELISGKKLKLVNHAPALGDVKLTIADTQLQTNLIGFSPTVSLQDGLDLFWKWHNQEI
jgi:UDP-glucuronate 4-epimerase